MAVYKSIEIGGEDGVVWSRHVSGSSVT